MKKNAHVPWLCNAHTVLHLCWAILLYIYEYLRANAFKSCILMLWKYVVLNRQPLKNNLKFEQSLCWKDEVYGYLNFKVIFEGHTVCEVGDHGKQTQVYLQKIRGPEGLLNNANTNWILTSQMSQRRQGSRFFPFREVGEVSVVTFNVSQLHLKQKSISYFNIAKLHDQNTEHCY